MTWEIEAMCDEIRRNEGGFVNDPDDSGGATKYGISLNFAKTKGMLFDVDGNGVVDVNDIRAMEPDRAAHAYITFFYEPAKLAHIPNILNIQFQLFDLAVNTGVRYGDGKAEAIMVLQHAIGEPVDGLLGPDTLQAFTKFLAVNGQAKTNNVIVAARCKFYDAVVAAHPQDQKFLDGWKRRANKYLVPEG